MGTSSSLLQFSLDDPATRWPIIGAGVAVVAYFALIRPMRRRKDPLDRGPSSSSSSSSLAQQRSVERDMSNLLVEFSEMTRQMTAQLDTRAAKLELLIREADEKIAAMRAAGAAPGAPGSGLYGQSFAAPEDRLTPPPPARPRDPAPPPQQQLIDPRHAVVYDLADQGRSSREIAQELGRPNGEIELILALRDNG